MAIKKIRFLWYNYYDLAATIKTASSEAAGFPLTNIALRWHTRQWRSTGVADEWIKANLGQAIPIKAFGIKNHNFPSDTTIHIQAHSDDISWAAPALNVALPWTIESIVKFWETAQNYQWWRLRLQGGGAPAYRAIGRIFLGGFFQPTYDVTRPPHHIPIDPSLKLYSTGGQASVDERTHYEKISFEWDMIPEADRAIFRSIFDHVGVSKPYFICRDPDDAANTTYYVQNLSDFDFVPIFHGWYELYINVETMR